MPDTSPILNGTGRREALLPGPAFRPCPRCGQLALYRIWHHGTKAQGAWWEELAAPVTFCGEVHQCEKPSVAPQSPLWGQKKRKMAPRDAERTSEAPDAHETEAGCLEALSKNLVDSHIMRTSSSWKP